MKTIGLLGIASPRSNIEYYRYINTSINKRLGKNHSAKMIISTIDYEDIKQYNYTNWDKIGDILMDKLIELSNYDVDCILIGNNTLHKALDDIEQHLYIEKPIFHIVDCVGEYVLSHQFKSILLLGTKFTMEDGFYHNRLKKYASNIITPPKSDRDAMHRINKEELSQGICNPESSKWFQQLVKQYSCDAVVVACTELPAIIKNEDYEVPIINTLNVHCDKAVDFVFSSGSPKK